MFARIFPTHSEVDETALPKYLLKSLCAWPKNRSTSVRLFAVIFQFSSCVVLVAVMIFGLTEAKSIGFLQVMQSISDVLANLATMLKYFFIRRNSVEILRIRKLLKKDFKLIETALNIKPVREKRKIWPWLTTLAFLTLVSTNLIVLMTTMVAGREHRFSVMRVPTYALRTDSIYFPLLICFVIGIFAHCWVNTLSDALFIIFTSVLCDKANTLIKMIKLIKSSQYQEQHRITNQIIRYHQLNIELHRRIEQLCSAQVLAQVLLILVSIGTLLMRVIHVRLQLRESFFVIFYFFWVIGQLITYCVLGDKVTSSCSKIADEVYDVYVPNMSCPVYQSILLFLIRVQRPVTMAGLQLVTLNRVTLLKIFKRSYSLCSTLFKLKNRLR